jgi:hypothetical protein
MPLAISVAAPEGLCTCSMEKKMVKRRCDQLGLAHQLSLFSFFNDHFSLERFVILADLTWGMFGVQVTGSRSLSSACTAIVLSLFDW